MPNPSLLFNLFRELVVERTLPREPEPDLIMDDPYQVEAYSQAGKVQGTMAAAYLFHSARISQVIQDCNVVLDLGCGPATQLAQVAELNPQIKFIGVDLSASMLDDAKRYIEDLRLENVSFQQCDMSLLDCFEDSSMDGIVSTMAFHHFRSYENLVQCFKSINRVLKPNGKLYLTDFGRLKSLKSVIFFAYMNARNQPHLFSLDYERSLRAAFLRDEFEELAKKYFSSHVSVISTYKVPFLVIIKTEDLGLPKEVQEKLNEKKNSLLIKYKNELNDLRLFFKLGGLRNDPFL